MPKWRNGSTFGPGRRVPLDRERRARFVWLVREDRRHGRLSATGEDVGIELVKVLGHDGQLDPSHDTLAVRCGCDARTVRRTLKRLKEMGRVTWERRLRRDVRTGWRAEQTSNAYVLCPESCGGHSVRAARSRFSSKRRSAPQTTKQADREARENAARQLRTMGFPVPDKLISATIESGRWIAGKARGSEGRKDRGNAACVRSVRRPWSPRATPPGVRSLRPEGSLILAGSSWKNRVTLVPPPFGVICHPSRDKNVTPPPASGGEMDALGPPLAACPSTA